MDGSAAYYHGGKPTGLLTRFVPNKLKHTVLYRWLLRLTRVFQFLSSIVSLGIFSQSLYKVYRLVNSIKTRHGILGADGAVEGILAAAVLYTITTTLFGCIKKNSSPGRKWLHWLWVLLDIAFFAAFVAVSPSITAPPFMILAYPWLPYFTQLLLLSTRLRIIARRPSMPSPKRGKRCVIVTLQMYNW